MCVTPLGLPGAAGGEEDERRRGGRRRGNAHRWRRRLQKVFEARATAVFGAVRNAAKRQFAGECALGEVGIALGVGHENRRAADFERMIDLRSLIAVVERRGNEPRFVAGEIVDDERAAIRQQRGDAVARL